MLSILQFWVFSPFLHTKCDRRGSAEGWGLSDSWGWHFPPLFIPANKSSLPCPASTRTRPQPPPGPTAPPGPSAGPKGGFWGFWDTAFRALIPPSPQNPNTRSSTCKTTWEPPHSVTALGTFGMSGEEFGVGLSVSHKSSPTKKGCWMCSRSEAAQGSLCAALWGFGVFYPGSPCSGPPLCCTLGVLGFWGVLSRLTLLRAPSVLHFGVLGCFNQARPAQDSLCAALWVFWGFGVFYPGSLCSGLPLCCTLGFWGVLTRLTLFRAPSVLHFGVLGCFIQAHSAQDLVCAALWSFWGFGVFYPGSLCSGLPLCCTLGFWGVLI
nr:uncharacterized protein LOC121470980 [Taeniopygia guttata]